MTTPPTHADLVARALGALGPEDQAQVDLALAQDAELRRQYEEVAAHLLRYEHLPPAPPAPSLDRLRTALDGSDARPDLAILQLQRKPARTRWIAGMTAAVR